MEHYGIVPASMYQACWVEIQRGELLHHVWNGRPEAFYYNLLCVAAENPSPTHGLIRCDKIRELLESSQGFDEAVELYVYEQAIRRL